MGTVFCHHHQTIVGQMKTPVQCVENPKGSGGVILYDRETFAMNKQHLFFSLEVKTLPDQFCCNDK